MTIYVYADWNGLQEPALMGLLTVSRTKGRSVFSFEYDAGWLKTSFAQNIDPDLQLYAGPQYLSASKHNFGVFLDSSPDRWGRVLMDRREALLAKAENRKEHKLFEEDYLLGVYDQHRMGGLRFKIEKDGPFLNDDKGHAAPPWTTLRELEAASLQLENGTLSDAESFRWINLLLAPGASLGGARPKASVQDENGALWIAKFPSIKDKVNIGAWEMVAYQLAIKARLYTDQVTLRSFNSEHHTFLSKRFDRDKKGRIHFASAMTLLGLEDGVDGISYLNLVEFIMQYGSNVKADLEELFLRIVFNIGIRNTDDHLRNHGFLLTPQGWTLSPVYDINPVYYGTGLTLNISETDNSIDFELAKSVAPYFRLNNAEAQEIIDRVRTVRESWRTTATGVGISRAEQEIMESAFTGG